MAHAALASLRDTIAAIEGRVEVRRRGGHDARGEGAQGSAQAHASCEADASDSTGLPAVVDRFFGLEVLDGFFPRGVSVASLHEIATDASRDGGVAAGFAVAFILRCIAADKNGNLRDQSATNHSARDRSAKREVSLGKGGVAKNGIVLWISTCASGVESGGLYASGCAALGLDPRGLLLVRTHRPADVLWAMEEGLVAGGVMAVIGEIDGDARALDLTATRRLALRSERHGVPALLVRSSGDREPSAARTRWRVGPARGCAAPFAGEGQWQAWRSPGTGLPLVGFPVWRIALVRNRDGRCGEAVAGFMPTERCFFQPDEDAQRRGDRPTIKAGQTAVAAAAGALHEGIVTPFPARAGRW